MFPLFTQVFPDSAAELERLLNESLSRLFAVGTAPVTISATAYPHIEEVRVTLEGGRISLNPPPPPAISAETLPALQVAQLSITADAFAVGPATINFSLTARDVQLGQGKDNNDQIVLVLDRAADGSIALSAAPAEIEALIAALAKQEARKQGVIVDSVQLTLRGRDAHSLAAEVHLRARKLFLSATIRITAQLGLDEQLNARISGARCTGDGPISSLACGFLAPHLQKIDGRIFPLMSLPLGQVRLRDVQMSVGNRLTVTAQFGNAA